MALPLMIFSILVAAFVVHGLHRRCGADRLAPSDPERLATLLVSELELYNAERLAAARQVGAIAKQLDEEIARARQMFDDRIPAERRADHFDRALVTILADGDASLLGPRKT